jgi:hypothetical protein
MHKSITIGLFSIVMIGMLTATPLANNNFFSNAMGQDYGYEDDSYNDYDNKYSKYPTEVNKYECQKGPFEGFFVGSVEFCKRAAPIGERDRGNGTIGPQGPPGPAGEQGIQGPPGPVGEQGIQGPPGPVGEQGIQGPPGPAGGLPGPQGPPGPIGATGPQGEQGERGLTGATGLTGMTGPAGEDGVNGTQGPRGFNGTDGVNGTQGPQGPAGISKINATNYYSITGPNGIILSPSIFTSSTVSCLPGDFALSGKYLIFNGNPVSPTVSFFGGGNPPTSWSTEIFGNPGQGVQTTVNCFDNSP